MKQPVLFAVDHDETARRTLARCLERRFGADYRIIADDSATRGLATLEALRRAGDEVAIVIAAHQFPEMTGIAFLDRADDLHPEAQRGLLVAPGPAGLTRPILRARLFDHFDFEIATPWVSPEEWLYPTITDALSAWTLLHRPRTEAVIIVDRRWNPRGHELRDLLERSGVPYGFYALDSTRGQDLMADHDLSAARLPIAIHRDGTVQVDPSNEALAAALGVATQPPEERVDLAIVGSGPAGLAAAVYGASEGLRTVVVESGAPGGQAATSHLILNYLGFPRGLSGRELTSRAYWQALLFGTQFVFTRRAVGLAPRDGAHVLTFDNGTELISRAVVVATGIAPRRLGIPALEALIGRGVFYGATGAEAETLQGEDVCVVGGGNSAGQATLHLAKFAARVTLIARGDALAPDMSDYLIQRIGAAQNVAVRLDTRVVDATGERRLRGLVLEEDATGTREHVPTTALFVEIGGEPHTEWLPPALMRDEQGRLLTGRNLQSDQGLEAWPRDRTPFPLETSVPGVFAAGDVRRGSANRVASAVGDGAVVIRSVHAYLDEGAGTERVRDIVLAGTNRGSL
jgi:thioredoxin reductase (NADPH)